MSATSYLPVAANARPAADLMTDVVIVGSSPGALCAAIACRQLRLEVLLMEPSGKLGGPGGGSDGRVWLPGHHGLPGDDYATARDYFDRVVGDFEPCSSAPRRHAFLNGTAALASWLADLGVELEPDVAGDYYPDVPGALASGRVLRPGAVDLTAIGQLAEFLPGSAFGSSQGVVDKLESGVRRVGELATGRRWARGRAALEAGLLAICQRLQVNIWWQAPVRELLMAADNARVSGVVADRAGRQVRVFAGRGVILADGGFGADAALRRQFLPKPSRPDWTIGKASDAGVRQLGWAQDLGLQLAGMGYAWWRPGLWAPSAPSVTAAGRALARPHGFLVDEQGQRFTNEAGRPVDVARAIYARFNDLGPQATFWLVIDADHRKHYRLGKLEPGRLPRAAENSGLVVSARTLPELATKIKVDAAGLHATAVRFNALCETGTDEDFHRGTRAWERDRGDRKNAPNPCLGAVAKPPFYAVRVVPADLGTKGGLLTDEYSRALFDDGRPMPGLWAIGSSASSVTGPADPAPGVGLAEAMVAGRAAAASIATAEW
ncbi:FAD-binding protein [Propionimicrobium sp. PCR01-08-3]|uniref:FAD-binding protein n=1 Tax=Propionimicrobium sp. PCR01-08-3 TaxID=3052086 RepID=UPI00255C36DF|nr:FAD-binding protein [Propionimicrobium sp. PCR01-08-3]WIY82474.1 FAD-binding protein [Propionimicrobium sp. PCR01-08-3]